MLVYKDGQVKHYKEMFPNTSFTSAGPSDSFLEEQGAVKVSVFKEHDRNTQKLVSCDPYVEGSFAYVVKVENKSTEEIAADVASKAAQIRSQRDQLLKACDWTQLADAPVDKAAWATYRQALRDLPNQAGFPDVQFPKDPTQAQE